MNGIPESIEGSDLVKRAVLAVVVLAALIAGTVLLLDLASGEHVTVTFEDDIQEHVSDYPFEHQTPDAKSGRTVITNSQNGVSPTDRSLVIMFREPKESVSINVSTAVESQILISVIGLDRNGNPNTDRHVGSVKKGEWRLIDFDADQVHGVEVSGWFFRIPETEIPINISEEAILNNISGPNLQDETPERNFPDDSLDGNFRNATSEDIPENIPENIPEDFPEDIPEDFPENFPEDSTNEEVNAMWADDLSFREPPTLSEDSMVAGAAMFWVFGVVTLLVTTGLSERVRSKFDWNR